jgi:hypothetical protein
VTHSFKGAWFQTLEPIKRKPGFSKICQRTTRNLYRYVMAVTEDNRLHVDEIQRLVAMLQDDIKVGRGAR